MVKFTVECVKCGSSDVDIEDTGGDFQLVCRKCGEWEEYDQ